ncbi:trk system potassium uptake protein TrkH [Modicisalibacter muralis]|uniref:Trk system potassium uptake protein TrkH n=1 Tax=Modicisalibacter muralis TaxID=119000 RepID=A0A1G9N141_9GAMM|nr:TrkH family potassium uptake protein [Halomonas muralis]SDL80074.1 trk system potassium uptake protein TrkH [Halomonas muralis]
MTYWQRLIRPLRRTPHGPIIQLSPPEILLLGFVLLGSIGTSLLLLPAASNVPLSWHQALFTATSAMTVTGLTVVDTSSLTLFGQLVVLGLIQVGGLGFMVFAALTVLLLGMRLPLAQQNMIRETLNHISFRDLKRLVGLVIVFTAVMETTGALLLAIAWVPEYGWRHGMWTSVFHAISAFNNAGFSIWSNSLTQEVANPLVNAVITALIVIGGLGFLVIGELSQFAAHRHGPRMLSLHTRIVLHATFWLLLISTIAIALLEWNNPATLGGLDSLGARLQAAWFQAVTPRTAGFNTLDTSALGDATALLTMLLMFIGAGSGSTASGIKVTTFVVLFLIARAFIRGDAEPSAFGRTIGHDTVMKAVSVALAGMLLIFTSLFVMTLAEPDEDFLALAFETVSAFGTVGLSRGITETLSVPAELTLAVTMLLGRVGPLSLGYFLSIRQTRGIKYADGQVQIG